jgi:hypothetical protein
MGAWGMEPWENDGAAEWFGDVMENSDLPLMVEAALVLDADEYSEDIRAAAYVLLSLGRVFIWPVDKLDEHLKLAIDKLRQIAAMEVYAEAGFAPVIEKEIAELESRLKKG